MTALIAVACADATPEEEASSLQLSKQQIVIGESLEFYASDLVDEEESSVQLLFEGTYHNDDGSEEQVNRSFSPIFDGYAQIGDEKHTALRLSRFGPFENPLSQNNRPGVFRGTVTAITEDPEGLVIHHKSEPLDLEVKPSILIEAFEPFDTECGAPVLRVLPGTPYVLRVRSVGISAQRYRYEFSNINGFEGLTPVEHEYDTPVPSDSAGMGGSPEGALIFNPVPEDQQMYVSLIRVFAFDAEGRSVETALPIPVHRPMEMIYDGARELAEYYEAVPVSGCIPGGVSTVVSYSETTRESRQQQVSVSLTRGVSSSAGVRLDQNWQEGFSEGNSVSRSMGGVSREEERTSESYGLSYSDSHSNDESLSSSNGEDWNWNSREGVTETEFQDNVDTVYGSVSGSVTVNASAEGSVPGFAKVTGKVSSTVGVTAGGSMAGTEGVSRSQSSERGHSAGGSHSESQSFGSTTTESQQESLSGSFALSRSRERSESDQRSRDESHVWNLSEGRSLNQSDGESFKESESQSWANTQSHEVGINFSSRIPRNKVGVFYRQTSRYIRRAELRSFSLCGLAHHVGELQFNEWEWAPAIAIGDSCDESLPKPDMPSAICIVEPCGG